MYEQELLAYGGEWHMGSKMSNFLRQQWMSENSQSVLAAQSVSTFGKISNFADKRDCNIIS